MKILLVQLIDNLGMIIIRIICLERLLIDFTIDHFKMNLLIWYLRIKLIVFKISILWKQVLKWKKCAKIHNYKNNHKVKEFIKKDSKEKIKYLKMLKLIKFHKFRIMRNLNKKSTDTSFNYFMKPSIYKWLKNILI